MKAGIRSFLELQGDGSLVRRHCLPTCGRLTTYLGRRILIVSRHAIAVLLESLTRFPRRDRRARLRTTTLSEPRIAWQPRTSTMVRLLGISRTSLSCSRHLLSAIAAFATFFCGRYCGLRCLSALTSSGVALFVHGLGSVLVTYAVSTYPRALE